MPFTKIMIVLEKPPLAFKVAETGFALTNALNAKEMLLGSVLEDLLRRSTCPVMLIRESE